MQESELKTSSFLMIFDVFTQIIMQDVALLCNILHYWDFIMSSVFGFRREGRRPTKRRHQKPVPDRRNSEAASQEEASASARRDLELRA